MIRRNKKRLTRFLLALALLYLAGGVVLYFIQDLLLFHPKPLPPEHRFSFDQPFEELNYPFEGRSNLSIVKFKAGKVRKGLVLFFHGNMRHVEHYKKYPSIFTRNGYEIWMIDYPGFGKSTGPRTEAILYRQAMLFYQLAREQTTADSIVLYGKSIGTGIASQLASKTAHKRLILETPYYSIAALARHYFPIYPVLPLTKYRFPNYRHLQQSGAPVTIFHGTKDEIIPYRQSLQLKKEKPSIELIAITGGRHNDLSSFAVFQRKIDSLLAN